MRRWTMQDGADAQMAEIRRRAYMRERREQAGVTEIVGELRLEQEHSMSLGDRDLFKRAADEIERLRAENEDLKSRLRKWTGHTAAESVALQNAERKRRMGV